MIAAQLTIDLTAPANSLPSGKVQHSTICILLRRTCIVPSIGSPIDPSFDNKNTDIRVLRQSIRNSQSSGSSTTDNVVVLRFRFCECTNSSVKARTSDDETDRGILPERVTEENEGEKQLTATDPRVKAIWLYQITPPLRVTIDVCSPNFVHFAGE